MSFKIGSAETESISELSIEFESVLLEYLFVKDMHVINLVSTTIVFPILYMIEHGPLIPF